LIRIQYSIDSYYNLCCSIGSGCQFPSSWHGEYFHLGYSQPLIIINSSISGKGRCVENLGSQYIMEDKEYGEKCWRCMTIFRKHQNVLQYRESKQIVPFIIFNDNTEKVSEENIFLQNTGNIYFSRKAYFTA
jgi:hypothetical protein